VLAGEGALVFDVVGSRTAIAAARARAPLKLLTPKNHGDARWTYVATYGGGLVDGDAIALDVRLGRGARAVLATQASQKVYRCPRGRAGQSLDAEVADGALLVCVPDPLVPFAGSRYEQRTTLRLAEGASLAWVDVVSCGRASRGERWAMSSYASRTRIVRGERLVCDDALVLDAATQDLPRSMGRFDAIATMFLVGPELEATRAALLARPLAGKRAPLIFTATPLGDFGACVRVAATSAGAVTAFVRDALIDVRASLGDDPFARKW
jgi:urease accessory protein